jgi:phytoene dehydrogenase-like protein
LSNDFDAIIIGAGIGGLTCGAFLAHHGMRVAVCERHFQIGGYAQNFTRKRHTFDSSVHSVSMADSGYICGLLGELGIRDRITITPNTCTMHVISPQVRYSIPAEINALTETLCRDFPGEKDSIPALLSDMQVQFSRYKGAIRDTNQRQPRLAAAVDIREATRSYKNYIAHFVRDETLRHLFHSIWPFAGTPPSIAPVFNAFIFVAHAIEGSHHVKGGFAALAEALAGVIVRGGGEVRTRWPVCGMRVDDGKTVRAVVNAAGDDLTAACFVSNISPYILHRSIVPEPYRNRLWLSRLESLRPSVSAVCAYLGISGDASDIVKDSVTFWFDSEDHEALYKRILTGPADTIDHLLVMRPPDSVHESTLTLISFARPDAAHDWETAKEKVAGAMIDKAVALFGDFRSRINTVETASPATFERYTGNTGGALYGFENVKDLYGQSKLPLATYFRNLYQAGHWTKSGSGIYNVMSSGRTVATMILNG